MRVIGAVRKRLRREGRDREASSHRSSLSLCKPGQMAPRQQVDPDRPTDPCSIVPSGEPFSSRRAMPGSMWTPYWPPRLLPSRISASRRSRRLSLASVCLLLSDLM
uniref:Uncharacterized protein n=1 Tax=Trichuris muris TaxID=70415 RepID=A0A5S6QZ45_TRIMR